MRTLVVVFASVPCCCRQQVPVGPVSIQGHDSLSRQRLCIDSSMGVGPRQSDEKQLQKDAQAAAQKRLRQAFRMFLLTFRPRVDTKHCARRATSSQPKNHRSRNVPHVSMGSEPNPETEANRTERLKLQAEKAKLEAQRAELIAEKLDLQAQWLELKAMERDNGIFVSEVEDVDFLEKE